MADWLLTNDGFRIVLDGNLGLGLVSDIANARLLGRGTTGTGAPEALTLSSDYGVTFTYSSGALKINTPQDLRVTASPTFIKLLSQGGLNLTSTGSYPVPYLNFGSTYGASGYGLRFYVGNLQRRDNIESTWLRMLQPERIEHSESCWISTTQAYAVHVVDCSISPRFVFLPHVGTGDLASWVTIVRVGTQALYVQANDSDVILGSAVGGILYCNDTTYDLSKISLEYTVAGWWGAMGDSFGIWRTGDVITIPIGAASDVSSEYDGGERDYIEGIYEDYESPTTTGGLNIGGYGGVELDACVRFASVKIPSGATIASAKLQMYASGSQGTGTAVGTCYGVEELDTASFETNPFSRDQTAANVDFSEGEWTGNVGGSGWCDSPDISAIVQEIIDQVGWASGNAMGFLIYGDEAGTKLIQFMGYHSHDAVACQAARLIVEFTT